MWQRILDDAYPGITDLHRDAIRALPCADLHHALPGALDGVVHEVEEDLMQPRGITLNEGEIVRQGNLQLQPFGGCQGRLLPPLYEAERQGEDGDPTIPACPTPLGLPGGGVAAAAQQHHYQ